MKIDDVIGIYKTSIWHCQLAFTGIDQCKMPSTIIDAHSWRMWHQKNKGHSKYHTKFLSKQSRRLVCQGYIYRNSSIVNWWKDTSCFSRHSSKGREAVSIYTKKSSGILVLQMISNHWWGVHAISKLFCKACSNNINCRKSLAVIVMGLPLLAGCRAIKTNKHDNRTASSLTSSNLPVP